MPRRLQAIVAPSGSAITEDGADSVRDLAGRGTNGNSSGTGGGRKIRRGAAQGRCAAGSAPHSPAAMILV